MSFELTSKNEHLLNLSEQIKLAMQYQSDASKEIARLSAEISTCATEKANGEKKVSELTADLERAHSTGSSETTKLQEQLEIEKGRVLAAEESQKAIEKDIITLVEQMKKINWTIQQNVISSGETATLPELIPEKSLPPVVSVPGEAPVEGGGSRSMLRMKKTQLETVARKHGIKYPKKYTRTWLMGAILLIRKVKNGSRVSKTALVALAYMLGKAPKKTNSIQSLKKYIVSKIKK